MGAAKKPPPTHRSANTFKLLSKGELAPGFDLFQSHLLPLNSTLASVSAEVAEIAK